MNPDKQPLRALTRGAYDIQKLRIEMGNRLCAAFRTKLGIEPTQSEDAEENEDAKEVLDEIRASFKKITDGIKKELPAMKDFKGDSIISTYTELCLVAEYLSLESEEDKHFRRLGNVLTEFPIYTEYLEGIKGCGPAMSALIISEFDIAAAEYPSSLWKYAGFDVCADGRGRSRREEHLVKKEYQTKDGKSATRNSITFNPHIKTKLYVLGGCLIKCSNERYRAVYDGYKHRLETVHPVMALANDERRLTEFKADPKNKGKKYSPKAHRHNMSMRYMIKQFLADLYTVWRKQEGLPVAPTYFEAKSGKQHGKAA